MSYPKMVFFSSIDIEFKCKGIYHVMSFFSADHSNDKTKGKSQKSLLERWEDSLMSCTNLAQVFIHLSNLDNCISWDKSVLNARCSICRRKGDAEHMLLCDGCDKGFHMYCLKPPISKVLFCLCYSCLSL